jgi:hypothetical protein
MVSLTAFQQGKTRKGGGNSTSGGSGGSGDSGDSGGSSTPTTHFLRRQNQAAVAIATAMALIAFYYDQVHHRPSRPCINLKLFFLFFLLKKFTLMKR